MAPTTRNISAKIKEETVFEDPIDSNEQEEIIHSLKVAALVQSDNIRAMFTFVFAAISFLFVIFFVYGTFFPWHIRHASIFKELIVWEAFQIFYIVSAFNFYIAWSIVKVRKNVLY